MQFTVHTVCTCLWVWNMLPGPLRYVSWIGIIMRALGICYQHGCRSRGGTSPPRIWSRGTLMQIVPLKFLSCRYAKERCGPSKYAKIRFRQGLCPGPRWGSSRRSTRPTSRLKRGHSSPYLTPLGTDPPSVLAIRPPQNSSQICAYHGYQHIFPSGVVFERRVYILCSLAYYLSPGG